MTKPDDEENPDATPILLHPRKRRELFERGQALFNDERFYESHEEWEILWKLERGRDKIFLQGLIAVAAHFVHLHKRNWSGARRVASLAREKLTVPPGDPLYETLDVPPLLSALDYNVSLLAEDEEALTAHSERFLTPRLFHK